MPLGILMPGHQCRFAVRARAASRPGLFLGTGPDQIVPPRRGSFPPPRLAPSRLDAASPSPRSALPTPSPGRTLSSARGDGISTVCPSATPFGLALGPTNPPRMGLPEEPSAIRGAGFSPAVRYSCRHSHSRALHEPFQARFSARGTLPYHAPPRGDASAASVPGLTPIIVGARALDQ